MANTTAESLMKVETESLQEPIKNKKSLTSSVLDLFEKQVSCDITFVFNSPDGAVEKVGAHKVILLCRSPVFETMFSGHYNESSKNAEICITDADISSFKEMLRFIYSDEVVLTLDTIMQMMFLASKYMLSGLAKKCGDFLQEIIADDTVSEILNHVVTFGLTDIIEKCVNYMVKNISCVTEYKEFMNISPESLHMIVCRNDLELINEMEIIGICKEWARHQYEMSDDKEPLHGNKIRKILGKTFFEIRFASLSYEDFQSVSREFDLLSGEEKLLFFSCITQPLEENVTKLTNMGFNLTTRKTRYHSFNRFTSISTCFDYASTDTKERIYFSCNKPIRFGGIQILKGKHGSQHIVTVVLQDRQNRNILWNFSKMITSPPENSSPYIHLYAKKRILLSAKRQFKLFVVVDGPKTLSGKFTQCIDYLSVRCLTSSGRITFDIHSKPDGDGNGLGRVAGALFYPIK